MLVLHCICLHPLTNFLSTSIHALKRLRFLKLHLKPNYLLFQLLNNLISLIQFLSANACHPTNLLIYLGPPHSICLIHLTHHLSLPQLHLIPLLLPDNPLLHLGQSTLSLDPQLP